MIPLSWYYFITFKDITFRQFEIADLDQVRTLHEEALRAAGAFTQSGNWDADLNDIPVNYINNGGDFLVGLIDDQLVAMGAFRKLREGIAEIKRMRVTPRLQGQGIGGTLLTIIEAAIEDVGYGAIELDTTVKQEAACALYEKRGYVEIRREIEGYPLEVIFYRKELGQKVGVNHRHPIQPVNETMRHIEANLKRLHNMCVKKGLNSSVEDGLRETLETELKRLSQLPANTAYADAVGFAIDSDDCMLDAFDNRFYE